MGFQGKWTQYKFIVLFLTNLSFILTLIIPLFPSTCIILFWLSSSSSSSLLSLPLLLSFSFFSCKFLFLFLLYLTLSSHIITFDSLIISNLSFLAPITFFRGEPSLLWYIKLYSFSNCFTICELIISSFASCRQNNSGFTSFISLTMLSNLIFFSKNLCSFVVLCIYLWVRIL